MDQLLRLFNFVDNGSFFYAVNLSYIPNQFYLVISKFPY